MAASSGRTLGIITIVLGVAAGVGGLLYELSRHTRRALVLFIGAGVLIVLGIIFMLVRRRAAS